MNLTEKKIAEMLTENTGRHMLDSGGAYGRNWERNQGREFEAEPATTLSFKYGYMDLSHNLYHWLSEKLEYNPQLQGQFTRFANRPENRDESWFANVDAFREKLMEKGAGGIYGEGEPFTVNTYNHESLLSQVIQYLYWEDDNGGHVLLQVHGGCDVRGGYTAPKAFDVCEELGILEDQRGGVHCTGEDHFWEVEEDEDGEWLVCSRNGGRTELECEDQYGQRSSWYTDDGYHLYGSNNEPDLGEVLEPNKDFELELHDGGDNPRWGQKGDFRTAVVTDEDGHGYCPACGARLAGGFY